jgi:hypothetical protein
MNSKDIYYDADTLLEEVLDNMPQDIRDLFETEGNPTENDMADYYQPEGETLPEEFDIDYPAELQEFYDNACCPSASHAAKVFCGCGGSGEMPEHLRTWLEDQDD